MASGTTSVAPAPRSFSISLSSMVRTITGTLRRMRLHEVQDLQRGRRVLVAHHHRAGARQAGGHQALQPRGVAEHHALAGGGGLAHAIGSRSSAM